MSGKRRLASPSCAGGHNKRTALSRILEQLTPITVHAQRSVVDKSAYIFVLRNEKNLKIKQFRIKRISGKITQMYNILKVNAKLRSSC